MGNDLPQSAEDTLVWSWEHFALYAESLLKQNLTNSTIFAWLQSWSDLIDLINETSNRLWISTTQDTADEQARAQYQHYLENVKPRWQKVNDALRRKFLACGIVPDSMTLPVRKLRADDALFKDKNTPLLQIEDQIEGAYMRLLGAQTVEWAGEIIPLSRLSRDLQSANRELRERAWRMKLTRQLADRDALTDLWQRALHNRNQIALNAGFSDYRAYIWQVKYRFDYTPDDAVRLCDNIQRVFVPLAEKIYAHKRAILNVPDLRPWDLSVDNLQHALPKPFEDMPDFINKLSRGFHTFDVQFGEWFDLLRDENLLDLNPRTNKISDYMSELRRIKRPFVSVNATPTRGGVRKTLHELGHAFHALAYYQQPLFHQREVPVEFKEIAAMSMELLPLHALTDICFKAEDHDRIVSQQLLMMIDIWLIVAMVERFQHWAYSHVDEASDPKICDAQWLAIEKRFRPYINRDGLKNILQSGWSRWEHIMILPFYAIEYAMAQLGALQLYQQYLAHPQQTLSAYKHVLSLGGTVTLPELYATAGIPFAFDQNALEQSASFIDGKLGIA